MKFKEVSVFEKPRERLLNVGVESLSNNELLCLLLRCGNNEKDVFDLSNDVLNLLNSFNDLNELSINELLMIKGIGISKATIILAAIELGRRLNQPQLARKKMLKPVDVYNYFKIQVQNLSQEHLYSLYLDAKGHLIENRLIAIGTTNSVIPDIKEIFKWAYKNKAVAFILVHNHPSFDETPSPEDIKLTTEIKKQSELLHFILLDHIVIGHYYYSMKEHNKI